MLVRLSDHFLSTSPRRQLENSMAPFSANFDYRSQIIGKNSLSYPLSARYDFY